ncbi:MAG: hypothetical protein DIU83_02060 [Bacillota bacterium]|nr:MAG: hypothetical protein DIU83_02060 [Bacillota bacterium]
MDGGRAPKVSLGDVFHKKLTRDTRRPPRPTDGRGRRPASSGIPRPFTGLRGSAGAGAKGPAAKGPARCPPARPQACT